MLSKETIAAYNAERPRSARHLLCHAPFVNLNFEQNGNMTACCYNRKHILGTYPTHTIAEAWVSAKAEELRQYIRENSLEGECSACEEQISAGNFPGSKSVYYDEYAADGFWSLFKGNKGPALPKVFEFEISNTCNLECSMCDGYFSSAIRKNREKLPRIPTPYNSGFVDQVKDFLPHLTDAKFLGGEPFLIDTYYKIWDHIITGKLKTHVHITTNGTVLNKKVKGYLEKMKVGLNISIDSLNKENYERIRLNADFEKVHENIRWFIDYRNRKGLYLGFAVCPMQSNRHDIADIIRFCNEHDIYLYFNTVRKPKEEVLADLPAHELGIMVQELEETLPLRKNKVGMVNQRKVAGLIRELKVWQHEAHERKNQKPRYWNKIQAFIQHSGELAGLSALAQTIYQEISHYYRRTQEQETNAEPKEQLLQRLQQLIAEYGDEKFHAALQESYVFYASQALSAQMGETIKEKLALLSEMAKGKKTAHEMNRNILAHFDFMEQFHFILETPEQVIAQSF